PLNIAFFGSDSFSVQSLDRLYRYKLQHPERISSIKVVTRTIKPTGRNLKAYVDLPIGDYCKKLEESLNSIPVLRADSTEDILSILNSNTFSLAIAVSYGKLIPAKFLESCEFGGLNVHPSLLPKYSGSSPIQYTLLNDDRTAGCTVQTLHPTKFDQGNIILQSKEIPVSNKDNFESLQIRLGAIGSDLLVQVIDEGLFMENCSPHLRSENKYAFSLAPKIRPSSSEIKWSIKSSLQIKRMEDALGPLHSYKFVNLKRKKKVIQENQRVILSDIEVIKCGYYPSISKPGQFCLEDSSNPRLIIKTVDGHIGVRKLKFQACKEEVPEVFLKALAKRSGDTPHQFDATCFN
ncbi:methionyl-tRNA transformylase, partial [Scheffersomyces stipitis CBS 6054]